MFPRTLRARRREHFRRFFSRKIGGSEGIYTSPVGDNSKLHINRRIFSIFISLRQFMRRQGRAATRAPRQNFVIFIKQTARIGFFYNRPNFFHIFRVIGRVRMFLVQPKADAFGKFFPFFFVFPNVFPAFLIESGNAKTFNILF